MVVQGKEEEEGVIVFKERIQRAASVSPSTITRPFLFSLFLRDVVNCQLAMTPPSPQSFPCLSLNIYIPFIYIFFFEKIACMQVVSCYLGMRSNRFSDRVDCYSLPFDLNLKLSSRPNPPIRR